MSITLGFYVVITFTLLRQYLTTLCMRRFLFSRREGGRSKRMFNPFKLVKTFSFTCTILPLNDDLKTTNFGVRTLVLLEKLKSNSTSN